MIRVLAPSEAQALIGDGKTDIVDVRAPEEFATGHVPGARLVPLDQLKIDPRAHLPRDNVLFVCAKGVRSMTAAKLAEKEGLNDIYTLDGGTLAWIKAGLPIERPETRHKAQAPAKAAPIDSTDEVGLDSIVATNLREMRAKKGYSLDELAKLTGLGRSLLGQIELGRIAPSVSVLWKIARVFEVPFSALLAAPGRVETKVLPSATAKKLVSPDGRFSSRALFPFDEKQQVEFYELWLAAHAREDAEAHAVGTREDLVVASGRLALQVGSERFELGKGDAIVFGADVPHSYINPGNEECVIHLVMSYADKSPVR